MFARRAFATGVWLHSGAPTSADAQAIDEFRQNPYHQEAVALRRWDDLAKVPEMPVPGLDHYRPRLAKVLRAAS